MSKNEVNCSLDDEAAVRRRCELVLEVAADPATKSYYQSILDSMDNGTYEPTPISATLDRDGIAKERLSRLEATLNEIERRKSTWMEK